MEPLKQSLKHRNGGVFMDFRWSTEQIKSVAAELLVIGQFEDGLSEDDFVTVDAQFAGEFSTLIAAGQASTKWKALTTIYTLGRISAPRVLLVGLGARDAYTSDRAREVGALVAREAEKQKAERIALPVFGASHSKLSVHHAIHSLVEGLLLASYRFAGYRTGPREETCLQEVTLLSAQLNEELTEALACGKAFATGTNLARDLINTPGNKMTPTLLAEQAVQLGLRHGMTVEILERADMERLGMGALLAVAQGSVEPPKLIAIHYDGDPASRERIAYVGKGITFDSGGLSIKSAPGMESMKMDMGGGGAVIGAMEAIGRLRPKVNILALVACSENMPSGSAVKPGDVIHAINGKSIEVLNTDAEGRLALADAVAYANQLGATRIIDVATLTGAVLVALGKEATAAVTNDQAFLDEFLRCAAKAGERVWQLPAYEAYKELILSPIADVKNTGGRGAGTITAGLFIGEFVGETPWIHLDIAGTAWVDKDSSMYRRGATGVMVRSLTQLAKHYGKRAEV